MFALMGDQFVEFAHLREGPVLKVPCFVVDPNRLNNVGLMKLLHYLLDSSCINLFLFK